MNNFIEYFYGIKVDKTVYNDNYYSFIYRDYIYKLYVFDSSSNVNFLIDTNKKLIGNTLVSEIISNRNNEIVSVYNSVSYILIRIYANINKSISLEEINYLANSLYQENLNINWGMLWSRKIDYLEDLINENGLKYPLLVDSFNYFVGMAENAISYYNDILIDTNYKFVVSHKRIKINDSIEALYNPLNIIFDYRVRDISEYIKNSFFNNNKNIFVELATYLSVSHLSLMDAKLLVSRLMYPSFYFDLYEEILIDDKEEKIIVDVISRLDDYEKYLADMISFFGRFYDVDEVLWLKKRLNYKM